MSKVSLRDRLIKLLKQVEKIKKECIEIKRMQKQLKIPNIFLSGYQQKKQFIQKNDNNKQNNPNLINQAKQISYSQKQNKPLTLFLKRLSKYNNFIHTNNESFNILKKKNDQIKDVKASLITQLNQIKNMEKKQQALRKANQKIKAYNSEQKKCYRKSQDKGKINTHFGKLGVLETMSNYTSQNKVENSLVNSQISVSIPILTETKQKIVTLKCARGHEYYEGEINPIKQPNGNGRLEVCCSNLSNGGQNYQEIESYQGQFRNGKFHGYGTLSYKGGVKYVGEFKDGKRQGKGSLYLNGKVQIAKWENDAFVSVI